MVVVPLDVSVPLDVIVLAPTLVCVANTVSVPKTVVVMRDVINVVINDVPLHLHFYYILRTYFVPFVYYIRLVH